LGLVIGVIVSLTLAILGVQNALALGLLSGLLEFIPIVGPIIGAIAATLVALFQPTHFAGLSPVMHAAAVMGAMIVIQQLENNLLVPRIVGDALDLHPLLVMVAVFMGTSLAGILGAVLAAPVLASAKLVGVYAWRKMFDLPPFPDDWFSDGLLEPGPTGFRAYVRGMLVRRRSAAGPAPAAPAPPTRSEEAPAGE
jgi:predicted PurR-regulated permease PerM